MYWICRDRHVSVISLTLIHRTCVSSRLLLSLAPGTQCYCGNQSPQSSFFFGSSMKKCVIIASRGCGYGHGYKDWQSEFNGYPHSND